MYHNNPIKIDITGTKETISKIDKEILYKCYKTFYHPSNMVMVISGDFEPEKLLQEVKKRLITNKPSGEIKRIYPEEPDSIVKKEVVQNLEVSIPMYTIGIKDVENNNKEDKSFIVKKDIGIDILLNLILGRSSSLYQELYKDSIIFGEQSLSYEFGKGYAHILISGISSNPKEVFTKFKETVNKLKEEGINELDFERIKKMCYGNYVREYDDVQNVSRMFLADYFRGICSFDYLENIETINIEYLNQLLKDVFKEDKMVLSIVENK